LPAWNKARAFFGGNGKAGTIPLSSRPMLEKMKGHGYIGFDPRHLQVCQSDNAFLVGDALGLAQPMTGEGILPAVLSGHLCGLAIAEGNPDSYATKLRTHPIISDYRILHSLQTGVRKILKDGATTQSPAPGLLDNLIVRIFALLFSGKRIPGSHLLAKWRK
jgi:flavin-dependent dehydrogenase